MHSPRGLQDIQLPLSIASLRDQTGYLTAFCLCDVSFYVKNFLVWPDDLG